MTMVETCNTSTSNVLEQSLDRIMCPVSFFWQPTRWEKLYEEFSLSVVLPVAGYYCAELCATFPSPVGYQVVKCQVVDIDECQLAEMDERELCGLNAACINVKASANLSTVEPNGYMCLCQHGYFTVQLWPTVCHGQGFDVTFFLTEKDKIMEEYGTQNLSWSNNTSATSVVSVVYLIRQVRQHVLSAIQQRVVGMGDSVSKTLFQASSIITEQSISFETTNIGTMWKVRVRIAAAFVETRTLIFRDMAAVIKDVLVHNESSSYVTHDVFELYTHTICGGNRSKNGVDDQSILYDVCTSNSDCVTRDSGMCNDEVAYLKVHAVETNSKSTNVDSLSNGGFELLSVRFDMTMRKWQLDLEFEDGRPKSRRILLLSKTREINGKRFFMSQDDLRCDSFQNVNSVSDHVVDLSRCIASISDNFNVLGSFHTWVYNNSIDNLKDLTTYRDLATGAFQPPLSSCTAKEHEQLDPSAIPQTANAAFISSTKIRRITVNLGYDDVVANVGMITQDVSTLDIRFVIGMATFQEKDGTISSTVAMRDIVTKIGSHFVLSHDITNEQVLDRVVPEISISLNIVSSPVIPSISWGFVSFYITLPNSAISAGITFDQDVIPVDSVIGSIAYFENSAIDTNPYPCIYLPDVESYGIFSESFACGRRLTSVSNISHICYQLQTFHTSIVSCI